MSKNNNNFQVCPVCKKIHEIKLLHTSETIEIDGEEISYSAFYSYCINQNAMFENDEQEQLNKVAVEAAIKLTKGSI